jgi:hypothetical protein
MSEHDPEIEELRAKVHCAVDVEARPKGEHEAQPQNTVAASARSRSSARQGVPGSRIAMTRELSRDDDIRGPAYKGSLTGGAKSLFSLPPEGPALPSLVVAEAPIDALSVAAIENVRADTLYAATGGGMGPGTTAALISASIATCRTSARS